MSTKKEEEKGISIPTWVEVMFFLLSVVGFVMVIVWSTLFVNYFGAEVNKIDSAYDVSQQIGQMQQIENNLTGLIDGDDSAFKKLDDFSRATFPTQYADFEKKNGYIDWSRINVVNVDGYIGLKNFKE